jgi:hypothetical protein
VRPGSDADHSPPASAEVKNKCCIWLHFNIIASMERSSEILCVLVVLGRNKEYLITYSLNNNPPVLLF